MKNEYKYLIVPNDDNTHVYCKDFLRERGFECYFLDKIEGFTIFKHRKYEVYIWILSSGIVNNIHDGQTDIKGVRFISFDGYLSYDYRWSTMLHKFIPTRIQSSLDDLLCCIEYDIYELNSWSELRDKIRDGFKVCTERKKDINKFEIKKAIFNAPATIVIWANGDKTIVKCGENDIYDPEKGLAMCFAKRALGDTGNYYETFKKWLPEEAESYNPSCHSDVWNAYKILTDARVAIDEDTKKLFDPYDIITGAGISIEEAIGYLGAALDE